MSLLKFIASDLRVSPPAIASTCASDMSSNDSFPVMRVISSFNTSKSRLWLSLRVFTRYWSKALSSMALYFLARCPQKVARALSQSDTF